MVVSAYRYSIVYARKLKSFIPKVYNKWYWMLLIALVMLGVVFVKDTSDILGIRVFRIPTTSSSPTLLPGNKVVVDIKAYNNKSIICGDIIAFRVWIKSEEVIRAFRVIGLPNDIVTLNDGVLTINNRECDIQIVNSLFFDDIPVKEYKETLPNGIRHNIYRFDNVKNFSLPEESNFSTTVLPNHYYVLGDFRDNAMDSRYIGQIKREDIIGQLAFCYWGKDFSRINVDLRTER